MAKYKVNISAVVSGVVYVDADSEDDARELAYEEMPGGLCYQCSGGQYSNYSLDVGDFEIEEDSEYNGTIYKAIELVED